MVDTDKLCGGGCFELSVAAVPVSSPQLPGHHADMGLGRGSVNPELRMGVAPLFFSGFLTTAEAAIPRGPGMHC